MTFDPIQDLARRVAELERRAVTFRQGEITDDSPLSVSLGGDTAVTGVDQLDSAGPLATGDVVAALQFAGQLLILGRMAAPDVLWDDVATSQAISADSTWRDPSTTGPKVTVPRAGDYIAIAHADGYANGLASNLRVGIAVSTGTPGSSDYTEEWVDTAVKNASLTAIAKLTLAASDEVRVRYYGDAGGGQFATFARRKLLVIPAP